MSVTNSIHKVNGIFPDYLQDRLNSAPEGPGNRHKDICDLAYQMVGERIPDDQIFSILRQRYPDRDKSDSEIRRAINGAHRKNPQPADTSRNSRYSFTRHDADERNVIQFELSDTPAPCEIPSESVTTIDFLRTVFKPGETVCIVTQAVALPESDKMVPANSGTFLTVERWAELLNESGGTLQSYCDPLAGAWIRINPIKEGDAKGEDNSVSAYRHVLVEFDSKDKLEQWRIFKECGLPIAAVIDSGGKSLHAWVRVDARDAEEFKTRQEKVYEFLGRYIDDKGNKNPSRLSRLPGISRAGKMQSVVAFGIGAATWEEWEASTQTGSTEWFDLASLKTFDRKNDPNCVIGNRWLCRGGSLIVQGFSGIGKSSLVLQMALSWALGKDFFGLKPVKALKTVFVQAENDLGDFAEAYQDICETLRVTSQEEKQLQHNFHVGREAATAGAERFGAYVRSLIARFKPDILFFDPLLSYFGDDILKQQAASNFFRRHLQPIQNETGAIFVFVHHLGKPAQGGERQGPQHYGGLGSSDIVNWTRETATLSEEQAGIFKLELGKRGKRSGLTDRDGKPAGAIYLRHSETGVVWEHAEGITNKEDAKSAAENKKRENLECFIRHHRTVTLQQMKDRASTFGYGTNSIKSALDALSQNSVGSENPIHCFRVHVNGSDTKATVYSTDPLPEDGAVQSKDLDTKVTFVVA